MHGVCNFTDPYYVQTATLHSKESSENIKKSIVALLHLTITISNIFLKHLLRVVHVHSNFYLYNTSANVEISLTKIIKR